MSNLYDAAREGFLAGEIEWKNDGSTIKAALVRGYTFSVAHTYMSDVISAGGTVVATEELDSLTNTNGVADAADAVWEAVPEGDPINHVIIYQSSAVEGGSDVSAAEQRLIACIDRAAGSPLQLIPNGQDITGRWSPGADRIFRI